MTAAIQAWIVGAFWAGLNRWAQVPGNDVRAAGFVENMIEGVVASYEASQAGS